MELALDNREGAEYALAHRERWIARSSAYYDDVVTQINFFIPEGAAVLEVGCSTGWLLRRIKGARTLTGIDKRGDAIQAALLSSPKHFEFIEGNFEAVDLGRKFDFIIISDVLSFAYDLQALLVNAKAHLAPGGRIFVSTYNSYLRPLYAAAEFLNLKRRSRPDNWLTVSDIENLCDLSGLEVIRQGARAMVPWKMLGLGTFLNRWIAPLPFMSLTNLYAYFLLRPEATSERAISSVSVVIPARNEAGNIQAAIERLPRLSERVEVIFVEGNSTDNTWDTIQKVSQSPHPSWMSIKSFKQSGKGKANAVHKGFAEASGDVLMILDADLTVPPEDLPRFLEPLKKGRADFVHGCRLVYPMEGQAMRFLNVLGNKFFSICFTFILGQRFKDTLCGTKVFFRSDWAKILKLREYFGDFDPFGDFEMIFGAVKLNHKIAEIPIHYKARTYGETNIHRFRHGLILLRMVLFAAPRMRFIA